MSGVAEGRAMASIEERASRERASAEGPTTGSAEPPAADAAGVGVERDATRAWLVWAGALLLIAAGLAAYHNSLEGAFILDDERAIPGNPSIRHLWPVWSAMMAPPNSGLTGRPVITLSLALSYAMGGLRVGAYHAMNLATHILAGLLLYGIVRRMLASDRLRPRYGRAAPWLALAAAGIWMVHPLQTESVTYIVQRAESLMGLFFLLTLYCAIRGLSSARPSSWYVAAVMACALGMGCKEVMAAAPLLVLLYDWLFVSASLRQLARRRWGLYAGLAATWLILGAVLAWMRVERQLVLVVGLTPWRYLLTEAGVIVHYLRLSYWPHPLVLDYLWPLADGLRAVLPSAIVVLGLLVATGWALLRRSWIAFWGAWFFLILAPSSSVVPLGDVIFEHRMYLPLAAVVVLSVIGGYEALGWAGRRLGMPVGLRRAVAAGLVVSIMVGLGGTTLRRNEDYRTALSIYRDTVAKRPDNPRAQNNLGVELNKLGRAEEAERHFATAVRLRPDIAEARANLGASLLRRGQVDQAVVHLAEAVRLKGGLAEAHYDLGLALERQGDTQGAAVQFSRAVELDPERADARRGLARLARARPTGDAVAPLAASVQREPGSPQAHYDLGNALYRQGKLAEAMAQYSEAIRLNPGFAEAHNNLGLAALAQGDYEQAITQLSEALRLKPDYAKAHHNLGVALYRQGRIKEALAHLQEAVRLDPSLASPPAAPATRRGS
jgi:tetratricopeptide (TPR) repeat protein